MKKYFKSFGKITNKLKKNVLKKTKKIKTSTLRRNIFNKRPKITSKKKRPKRRPKKNSNRRKGMKGGS